jgi:hypothetical protein
MASGVSPPWLMFLMSSFFFSVPVCCTLRAFALSLLALMQIPPMFFSLVPLWTPLLSARPMIGCCCHKILADTFPSRAAAFFLLSNRTSFPPHLSPSMLHSRSV